MMLMFRSLQAKLAASAAVLILVLAIGWLLPLTPPSVFEAIARIWVQSKIPASDNQQSSSMFQSFMTYFNSPILTACEVLRSTMVLEEAAADLKGKLPANKIPSLGELKANIRIEPVQNTDIVNVYFRSTDGYVATAVVQAVLDAFGRLESTQASFSAVQSQTFLKQQLEDAQAQLKTVSSQIKDFQRSNGVIDLPGEVEAILKNRATLQDALKMARAQSYQDRVKGKYLQDRLGINGSDVAKVAEIAADPVLTNGRKKLAAAEFEYSSLSGQLRPEHPRMRQLKNLIQQLRTAGSERLAVLSGGSGIRTGTPTTSQSHLLGASDDIVKDMIASRSDEIAQAARQSALSADLGSIEEKVRTIPDKQLQLADLLRGQKVIFERISELETSINSAKLIEAVNTASPSFHIIDRPQIANVTVASQRPKLLTSLLLGLIMAGLTFFLLDRLDPRIRKISTVLDILPLPVLGWFSQLSPVSSEKHIESMHRLRLSLGNWLEPLQKQIVVTSVDFGDGKSTIAAGLAESFAQSGKRVLLIDADTVSASLHGRFKGVAQQPGVSDFLSSPSLQLWDKINISISKNLTIIPAGSKSASSSLLSSDAVPEFIRLATAQADIVIYDTPATSQSAAALALLSQGAALLVVVRLDHAHTPELRLLATQLRQYDDTDGALVLANVNDYGVAAALAKSERQLELEPV